MCDLSPTGPATNQAAQLAADLGLHCCFAPLAADDDSGAVYRTGLAVLTRAPVRHRAVVPVPHPEDEAARGGAPAVLHVSVETPGGEVDLLVVHLTPRSAAAQVAGVEALLAHLATLPPGCTPVVAGDFNATPDAPAIERMGETLRDAWAAQRPHMQVLRRLPVPPAEALRRVPDGRHPLAFTATRLLVSQQSGDEYVAWVEQPLGPGA